MAMKNLLTVGMLAGVVATSFGATTTINSVSELGESETLGNDTLKYVGAGSETYGGRLMVSPGSKLAATIDVSNKDAKLSIPAMTLSTGAGFVKTGHGELELGTGGLAFQTGTDVGGNYWGPTPKLTWTDGKSDPHWSSVVVHEGTLTLNYARDLTNSMPDSVVGMVDGTVRQARMNIESGTVSVGNSITIDRGAGTPNNHPLQSIWIGHAGTLLANNIWLTSSNGSSSYCGNSLLDIDGGCARIAGSVQIGRSRGTAKILVRNQGEFDSTQSKFDSTATMVLPYDSSSTNTVFEITGCSTGKFYQVATRKVGEKAVFKVNDGSTLMLDRYRNDFLTSMTGGGVAEFDDATIMPRSGRVVAEWFPFCEAYSVGMGGLTLISEIYSALGGASRGSGTITTKGGGTVSLHPGQADVKVEEGALRMTASPTDTLVVGSENPGRITVDSVDSTVEVVGDNALGSMTLVANGQDNSFKAQGLERNALAATAEATGWSFVDNSMPLADGWLKISLYGGGCGNIWKKERIDISRSFRLSYDYFIYKHNTYAGSYPPYGCSLIFQNTPEGIAKKGDYSTFRVMGFGGVNSKWPNAFAVGFDVAASAVRYSRHDEDGNYFLTGDGDVDGRYGVTHTAAKPVRISVDYNAETHKLRYRVAKYDNSSGLDVNVDVNLAERCGDSAAYVGFGAPNVAGSGTGEHMIGNVQLVYADEHPAESVMVGGKIELSDGKTFNARLDRNSRAKTWCVNELAYAGNSTVNVDGAADSTIGFNKFSGEGTLTKTGTGTLGLMGAVYPFKGTINVNQGGLAFDNSFSYASMLGMYPYNWWLSSNVAAFEDGGIGVGRAGNAEPYFTDNANSLNRVKVNCPWTITYDLKISIINVSGACGFYSIYFHNDPRGPKTVGQGEGSVSCVKGIANCAALVFGGAKKQGSYNNGNQVGKFVNGSASDWTSTLPVEMGLNFSANTTASTNGTVKLTYDPTGKTLKIEMTQAVADGTTSSFSKTFTNFDIPTAVGDDYAYIGFGANTAQKWFGIRQTVSNFAFTCPSDELKYVNGTIALPQGSTEIMLNANAVDGDVMSLADTIQAADGATMKLRGNNASAIAAANEVVCDGTLTIDGGIFAVVPGAFDGVKRLNLINGAKLYVASGESVTMRYIMVNGVRVPAGSYTTGFVTGGGTVVSQLPGLLIIVK